MALTDDGRKIMLEEFGAKSLKAALYGTDGQEITGGSYTKQTVAWTYDSTNKILNATATGGVVAEFDVPATTVKYVGFLNTGGTTTYAKYDLGAKAETFANPGKFQLTAASLELDPA